MTNADLNIKKVQEYLGMTTRPVGIKLFKKGDMIEDSGFEKIENRVTFCRLVHEAAEGKNFLMRLENLKCTNAELTLGMHEPKYGDIDFRIKDKIAAVRIGQPGNADVVILIVNPEQVMSMANIVEGIGLRFRKNRAVCGDCVTEVYTSGQPRISFLCIGSRTDGHFTDNELILSLPYKIFLELPSKMSKFSSLSRKAKDNLAQRFLNIH
jgi:uncharacterized protein (DUF169 family)